MENLSINRVLREAPAAARRKNADREGLIDTAKFLAYIERKHGFKPVFAAQGSGHSDSGHAKEKNGRHLVIAARPTTYAVFLLNSHTKDRRAHVAVGWWKDGGFLIGPSTPIQRWHGFDNLVESLDKLMEQHRETQSVIRCLQGWQPDATALRAMARGISRNAYLRTVEARPTITALTEGFSGSAKEFGYESVRRMIKGNLESSTKGGRRIKGVKRPDGLFHAGMVVMHEIMLIGRIAEKLNGEADFGRLDERLVRP